VLTRRAHEAAERIAKSEEDPRAFLRELTLVREKLYDRKQQRWVNFVDYVIDVVKIAEDEIKQWNGSVTSRRKGHRGWSWASAACRHTG
jgi:hypothetical protein